MRGIVIRLGAAPRGEHVSRLPAVRRLMARAPTNIGRTSYRAYFFQLLMEYLLYSAVGNPARSTHGSVSGRRRRTYRYLP